MASRTKHQNFSSFTDSENLQPSYRRLTQQELTGLKEQTILLEQSGKEILHTPLAITDTNDSFVTLGIHQQVGIWGNWHPPFSASWDVKEPSTGLVFQLRQSSLVLLLGPSLPMAKHFPKGKEHTVALQDSSVHHSSKKEAVLHSHMRETSGSLHLKGPWLHGNGEYMKGPVLWQFHTRPIQQQVGTGAA